MVYIDSLTKEAINWLKKDLKDFWHCEFEDGDNMLNRWMKRLNITETDLK